MAMANSVLENWLAAIVNHSDDAIIVIDTGRIIRFANSSAISFGQQSGSAIVVGEPYDDVLRKNMTLDEAGNPVPLESCPSIIALTEGKEVQGQIFQQTVNGKHSWVKVSSFPIFNEHNQVTHAVIRLSDITKAKSQEDKLDFLIRSSKVFPLTVDIEERLTQKARLTVPLIADWCAVTIVNQDGSLSRASIIHRDPEKMSLVNEFEERLSSEADAGLGARHVVATGLPEFYPDVTDEFLIKAMGGPSEKRVAMRSLGVSSLMILPILSQGSVLGVLTLAYGESGRKYTPDDMAFMQEYCNHISTVLENARLYEEIKRRDTSKDSFLATLSHELRNPLAPIKSMLELMKLQPHASEFRHNISVIEHQFDHLTKILTDLLEVNRYARGKIHVELRRVNLITVVRNSVESATPFFTKKNLEFEVSMPSHAIVIRADQTRLEQALMNVLHNAEKFTPEGGRIWIRVASDDKNAMVTIGDNGIGIDPKMLEYLFEPGMRDQQMQRTEGLGLGLVLVKEIIQLHGGTVTAKSEGTGKGSEFTITLPILQQRLL